jgi:DNA-binding transcriptional MerR regulator
MTEDRKTIRQMCEEFEVTPRTLRFYEAKELISPLRDGQKRLYGKRSQARLKLILQGKRFGFSLEEIRQLLDLYYLGDQQRTQMTKTYDLAVERLAAMKQQRDELNVTIAEFEEQLSWGANFIADLTAKEAAE